MKGRKVGFTLVELVIVVVGTGILLAIALSKFLAASPRGWVSRVWSDQRSLATAIEAYAVDTNTYPPSAFPTRSASPGQMTFRSYALLTTPVPYIAAIPLDAFAVRVSKSVSNGWQTGTKAPLIYYSGNSNDLDTPDTDPESRRAIWVLVSVGPDGKNGVSVDGKDPVSDPDPARTPYSVDPGDKAVMLKGGRTVKAPTSVRAADGGAWADVTYDASNGTQSRGDIIKYNSGVTLPRFISR